MANAEETRLALSLFDDEFNSSKKEQISQFLHDQQELNKRFDDYALNSESEDESPSCSAHKLRRKYSNGVRPEDLERNLNEKCDEDDRDSLDSVRTACSNSDSDVEINPKPPSAVASMRPMKNKRPPPLTTPRGSDVSTIERKAGPRLGRSQSLRVANKMDLTILKHAPQPPNSPDFDRDTGEEKPSLDGLKVGRRSSLRDSRRRPPKKLLVKRQERPKSALGYQRSLSLVNEDAYEEENGFRPLERSQCDVQNRANAAAAAAAISRSAPAYKNRILNWDTDCPKGPPGASIDSTNNTDSQVPSLSSQLDAGRTRGPTYAPAPLPIHSRPHPPVDTTATRSNTLTRNSSIRQSLQKRHSESSMPMNLPPKEPPLKPIKKLGSLSIREADDQIPAESTATGRMRRFKGHGNLSDNQLTPRGTHLAVLKLPPVSNKKKSYNNSDMPVRPGTSLSFFNTSETLV